MAGRAVEQRLNADHSDADSSAQRCACGEIARYVGRRAKTFTSVLGPLRLERAYFHCARCGRGFCPRDRQLGLDNTVLSPAVTRMVGTVGAMLSFEEGSQLLAELAGLTVDAKQVERTAEALGADIAEDEKQDVTATDHLPLPSTLYLGLDATGIPMRSSELQGRSGKQADGAAKTREVKLCTVWSAEGHDENGTPTRDPGSVTYSAAIETAATLDTDRPRSPFTERVLREATRRRFSDAQRSVVLGDGAPWIWKIAHELFPRAIQIVDRFHVKEHLSNLSKILYVNKPSRRKPGPDATRNSTAVACQTYYALCAAMPTVATMPVNVFNTSPAIGSACAIHNSTLNVCVLPLALWKLAANSPSPPV